MMGIKAKKRTNLSELEKINELYRFLTGEKTPDGMLLSSHCKPKMTEKKAFAIIWFLQERMGILPDNIERCSCCGGLYDTGKDGIYWESKGKFFCGACEYQVPENYDNNQRRITNERMERFQR